MFKNGDIIGGLMTLSGADIAVGAVQAYGTALMNNPLDTIAKTAIIVGGIALAIPSGGSSLLFAGAALTGVGIAGIVIQESWGYANAKTEEGLKEDAVSDIDDLLWIGTAGFSMFQGLKMADAINIAGRIEATTNEIGYATFNAGIKDNLKRAPGFITKDTDNLIQSFKDMGKLDNIKKGIYYIENKDHPFFVEHTNAIRSHELFGETAIENGAVEIPDWVNNNPVLRDIAADTAAARIVGKETFIKTGLPGRGTGLGHNWWDLKDTIQYTLKNGKKFDLSPEIIKHVQDSIKIKNWYGPSWSKYTLPINLGNGVINNR